MTNAVHNSRRHAVSGGAVAVIVVVLIVIAGAAYIYANPPASISGATGTNTSTTLYSFTNYGAAASTSATSTTMSSTPANAIQIAIPSDNGYPFAQYTPQIITVVIGVNNTVTWTNSDVLVHNMINPAGMFNSGDVATGQTFTFTFTVAGTFPYYCSYHPSMSGIVIVKAAA